MLGKFEDFNVDDNFCIYIEIILKNKYNYLIKMQ